MNLGPLGKRTISGIGFKATVPFLGLDNLKQVKYVYMVDTDMATQPGFMRLSSIINIVNPSKLTLSLGDVGFSTSYKGQPAGISTVSGLTLKPGDNYLLSLTSLDTKLSAAQQLMLDLPNADVPLTLTGYASSSQNPALNAGLATVSSQMVVPQNFQGLTMSQPPHKDWSLKTLPNTNTDGVVQVTATFQSPYYGLPLEFKDAQTVGYDSMAIIGSAAGISGVNLFRFMDNLTFSVSGTGSTTISFNVGLVTDFGAGSKAQWTDIVNYAKANGHLPIQFDWIAGIVLNNDSTYRYVDWGSIGTGLGDVNIAVGRDFESILGAFP
ncbi:hypothetical protein BX616_004385 [Lobosporangium transversale]|nr:hypothetical protein BX616_004385 [Lobosporangium transversale]